MPSHVKHINRRWGDLVQKFKHLPNYPENWTLVNLATFLELEAVLYLYEVLVPESQARSAWDAWALVSGYTIAGINDQPEQERMCLLLRQNLRYLKTASAWHWWFHWYQAQPESIRLYHITRRADDSYGFDQQIYGTALRTERIAAYARLTETVDDSTNRDPLWATAGTYEYWIDKQPFTVQITESIAAYATTPLPTYALKPRKERKPLRISLDDLRTTARELDDLEATLNFPAEERGHWVKRLNPLRFASISAGDAPDHEQAIEIDGLFHLAGALGVGKSSLISVMTYHLACKQGLHVTVVLNTIVETIDMAVWLRRLGVAATPALGKERANHQRKYGLARAEALRAEYMMKDDAPAHPVLAWMPAPCALSGTAREPIPVGKEPCYALYDSQQERRTCPLLPICPVHAVKRDLVNSQVWTVNPMSLLYSFALGPEGQQIPLLEAVYRRSDVLIIDEADRVQVQWDRAFAPTVAIAGSEDALLDALHPRISDASVGRKGRRTATEAAFRQVNAADGQAHLLASRAFWLLYSSKSLQKWVKRHSLTAPTLFDHLYEELIRYARKNPGSVAPTTVSQQLDEAFSCFRRSSLSREKGLLADWLKEVLASAENSLQLRKRLERILSKLMGWEGKPDADRQLLVNKLDFCITWTALLRRSKNLAHQLQWIEDETGQLKIPQHTAPDHLLGIVPGSPLGDFLNAHWSGQLAERDLGTFSWLRYQGVGRWLLLNLPSLYEATTKVSGPHVLLTSATSWLPGSAQFHIATPPQAVLVQTKTEVSRASRIDIFWTPVHHNGKFLPVSGAGEAKPLHLKYIIRQLARNGDLQDELDYWKRQGTQRRILLVVNSYKQADWVLEELERMDEWSGRALRLLSDDADDQAKATIRAREVEQFANRSADILIAPLLAIQRGFNILNQKKAALLGTVFFLVRPFPPPDDLSLQILNLNAWLMQQLSKQTRCLDASFSVRGIKALEALRRQAFRRWNTLVLQSRWGVQGMSDEIYDEYLRDTFIAIWQTIGRLIREEQDARVFFVDAKFGEDGNRHLLRDWQTMLVTLKQSLSPEERFLAEQLYAPIERAFTAALNEKRI